MLLSDLRSKKCWLPLRLTSGRQNASKMQNEMQSNNKSMEIADFRVHTWLLASLLERNKLFNELNLQNCQPHCNTYSALSCPDIAFTCTNQFIFLIHFLVDSVRIRIQSITHCTLQTNWNEVECAMCMQRIDMKVIHHISATKFQFFFCV